MSEPRRRCWSRVVAALAFAGVVGGGCARNSVQKRDRSLVLPRPGTTRPATPVPATTAPVAGVPETRTPVRTAGPVSTGPTVVYDPATPPGAETLVTSTTTATTTVTTPPPTRPAEVATADLGDPNAPVPGLTRQPKPFIAFSRYFGGSSQPSGRPTTLLQTHVSPDSPVPLSEYPKQPVFDLDRFKLTSGLTAAAVQERFGPPAALADADDPWYVYRVSDNRELWLHFTPDGDRLRAADVVRPIEDGYERKHVFGR